MLNNWVSDRNKGIFKANSEIKHHKPCEYKLIEDALVEYVLMRGTFHSIDKMGLSWELLRRRVPQLIERLIRNEVITAKYVEGFTASHGWVSNVST